MSPAIKSNPPPLKTQPSKSSLWLKLIISILALGMLLNAIGFLFLSGTVKSPLLAAGESSTRTAVRLEEISLSPATPTPFQPLPTDTPTPTPTITPTATPTNTPLPTETPLPTNTPLPLPVQTSSTLPADGIPQSASVNITGHNQAHSLSCESRSATDWAGYFGVSTSENSFQSLLPVSDNPDAGFVGSPDGAEGQLPPDSYGVHADPVAAVLHEYGLNATAVHGYSYDDLRKQIVAGHPVIVWVYGNVWSGASPVSYTSSDGHTTNVIRFEHTVIISGYDASTVTVLDGGMAYSRSIAQFLDSWSSLGNMAVILQ